MADGIRTSVKIEGLEALRRRFRQLPVEIQEKELGNAVAKGAAVIRDEAQARAPVLKTPDPRREAGLLRRMIRSTRGVRRDSEAAAFVSVRRLSSKQVSKAKEKRGTGTSGLVDAFYWKMVEFGTSMMAAIPFMRPAFDTKKEAAANEIKKALSEGVERQAKKLAGR